MGIFPEVLESFPGIEEKQNFYIDGDQLVIYFTPYQIGPYAAGVISFPIPFSQLEDVLDKEGAFWKAGHK